MAGFVGPEIPGVTDGLIFYVDAALTYTSGSTTWYDEINGNNGTLTNGPTYSTDGRGSIVFDGTNDYVEVSDFLPNNSDFTLAFWLNYSSSNLTTTGIISTWDTNWKGWGLANYQGNLRSWVNDGANGGRNWISISGIDNEWHLITLRYEYSTGTQSLYINTTSYGTNSLINTVSPSNLQIGRGGQTGTTQLNAYPYSNCKISNLKIYNKVLSPTEIIQNYNALKSRFNL